MTGLIAAGSFLTQLLGFGVFPVKNPGDPAKFFGL
jgi:hypothetical protein